MKSILERVRRGLKAKEWIIIEVHSDVWSHVHGRVDKERVTSQSVVTYLIEYCPQLDSYRLSTEGKFAKLHIAYGAMLKRLADYNTGRVDSLPLATSTDGNKEEEDDLISIVTFPLTNDAEEIWKLAKNEPALVAALNQQLPTIKKEGIEVFEVRHNIAATDDGYYAAVWHKDIDFSTEEEEGDNE